jgi:uncharacterized protein YqhQ
VRYGGQAVFEGVMMRGRDSYAVAVRTPDGGIEVREAPLPTWGRPLKDVPIVRGIVALAEALPLGFKALTWSAERGLGQVRTRPPRWWEKAATWAIVATVLVVGSVVPAWVADVLTRQIGLAFLAPIVETGLGVAMLYTYLRAVGKLDEIVRLFANHGAEHKTVNAYEAGAPLTVESVQAFSTRHPRCGTSFLLLIAVTSAVVFGVLGALSAGGFLLTRVVALPLVAGIAAELQLRLAEVTDSPLSRPGMALQRLTTREPSDAQVEVAIVALQAVLVADGVVVTPPATLPAAVAA